MTLQTSALQDTPVTKPATLAYFLLVKTTLTASWDRVTPSTGSITPPALFAWMESASQGARATRAVRLESGYVCDEDSHKCEAVSGKGLLGSINFRTSVPCSICSPEGVSMQLLGEKNALFPDSFPCNTPVLDNADTYDYGGSFGSWTSFDGTLNGS